MKRKMSFGVVLIPVLLIGFAAGYFYLPQLLKEIKSSPQIVWYSARPDLTWQVFSQCKQHVDDADACYQAYSAAVALAESGRCDAQGLKLKYRFKLLTQHASPAEIEKEIDKECRQR
ncbi:hypothetical protein [Erwinia phyllosphaerae]|uniref:hypothetical protein n=1 Tax=Erwinia phyllosphaerae TaxID=2853256 RepID=UPI001FF045F5|nr:hypothetical protein [Erwinia phyllosphaerae]MBV4368358.1 hypothetical protein [Erwinia phyllosphaerae]